MERERDVCMTGGERERERQHSLHRDGESEKKKEDGGKDGWKKAERVHTQQRECIHVCLRVLQCSRHA